MTVASAATASPAGDGPTGSALRFDRFLRSVERRAIRIAELGEDLHPKAVEHVARAMAELAGEWHGLAETDWPVRFWQRLQRRLATARGNAAARAFERRHDEEPLASEADALAGPDAMSHLEAALRALSTPQRLAFLLRVWEGLDLGIVAIALDAPIDTTRSELFHALQRLHARLAPGATDRVWVLRCRGLLDEWAGQLEPASLAPLAVVRRAVAKPMAPPMQTAPRPEWPRRLGLAALLAGAVLLGWRGYSAWQAPRAPAPAHSIEPLVADEPPPPLVEPAPIAAADYELLADPEHYALLQELDFYAWQAQQSEAPP